MLAVAEEAVHKPDRLVDTCLLSPERDHCPYELSLLIGPESMPTAVSLFSGAGGFCEGVRLAGFKLSCAVEMDEHAARTHGINFPAPLELAPRAGIIATPSRVS
jgi:C-5 cytosine-specific DNA methylase